MLALRHDKFFNHKLLDMQATKKIMTYKFKLIALEFSQHTPESFHDHVKALKRTPQKKSSTVRARKLPKLKGKQLKAATKKSHGEYQISLNDLRCTFAFPKDKQLASERALDMAEQFKIPLEMLQRFLREKKFTLLT